MEPKPIYKTALTHRIETLLKNDGQIRRIRLQRGLALAYAGNEEGGLLTISRYASSKQPSEKEIKIVIRDFKVAGTAVSKPVLKFKELSRETVKAGRGSIMLFVYQLPLGSRRNYSNEQTKGTKRTQRILPV